MLPTAVSSCNYTQFLQYNHRPLLTTLFPCSVCWPPQEAVCPHIHNTSFRLSYFVTHTMDYFNSGCKTLRYTSLLFEDNKKGLFCLATSQFLQYRHTPLLTIFPSSVLWPSHQAFCARLHNTCLRSSDHCDAHIGRHSFSHHTRKFLVQTFVLKAGNNPCCV